MTSALNLKGFETILQSRTQEIREIALSARTLLLTVYPKAHEIVWERQGNTGYGVGPKKMSEHFCYIMPSSKHVTFGFYYGTDLKDPKGLLEGSGLKFRHIKLKSLADVNLELRGLIEQAVQERLST